MHELRELKEKLCDELKEYGKKGDLSAGSLDVVDKLAHAVKNLDRIIESYDGESYSRGMYPYYGGLSYARGVHRDGMGRYSRAGAEMVEELHKLMKNAPDDRTRKEFQRFIDKLESM